MSPTCCIHSEVAIFLCCEQCINIYTFPFIISIKLNGGADRYLTDMAEAKKNDPILHKGGLGVKVIGLVGSILMSVTMCYDGHRTKKICCHSTHFCRHGDETERRKLEAPAPSHWTTGA